MGDTHYADPAESSLEAQAARGASSSTAQPTNSSSRRPSLEDGEIQSESEQGDRAKPSAGAVPFSPNDAPFANAPEISAGASEHKTGACKPCAWFHKSAARCQNGARCVYCHLCPPGELRRRKQQKILK